MDMQKAYEYIEQTAKFGLKPDLGRIRRLLQLLGDPHKQLKIIHVAGTNGKGSCCTMVAAGLRACGYRVGLFTSPHLQRFTERIRVDGEEIPESALGQLMEQVCAAVTQMEQEGMSVTQFDLYTALGFLWFHQQQCDYCIMETGLGGRGDPTNVVEHPVCTVIMSISYDHTAILGDTLAQIAGEKAGILKQGCPLVGYPLWEAEAGQVILERARQLAVPVWRAHSNEVQQVHISMDGTRFTFRGREFCLRLLGAHQAYNFTCAYGVMQVLGIEKQEKYLRGICDTTFVGRMELLSRRPTLLLDGGHNPEGVQVLARNVAALADGRPIITVMGMMKDKDTAHAVHTIAAQSRTFLAVSIGGERAESAEVLCSHAKSCCDDVRAMPNVEDGLRTALHLAGTDGVVLVCGSLYLLGEVRELWEQIDKSSGNKW